jgi:hypothetical protein
MADGAGFTFHDMPPPLTDVKRPLFRELPPAPEFPIHALGPLRDPVEALQMRTQAPMAICAQSILAAATLAVQAHRNVELPAAGVKPLTGLFASVADSGERKTTVDRLALAPVYRMEERWREQRESEMASYHNDRDAWKAARDTTVKKHKGDRTAIKAALDALGSEPQEPPSAMLLVSDPTPEALILHLKASRPWGGLFTAEGGLLLGGSAFNDETRMRTAALLNVLWDGEPIRRSRVGTGTTFLPGRRCSAHVMMQQVVADLLFGNTMLDGIGLLARFLVVAPDSTAGTRLYQEPSPVSGMVLDDYNERLAAILDRSPALAEGTSDVLAPPAMHLSEAACRLWIAFHDEVELGLGETGWLRPIRAFGAKMAEHAGRIAAVLAMYADPDAAEVDGNSMACGIELAQHYAGELLRLHGAGAIAPDLRLAAQLLGWWQGRRDPRCHLAWIYQRGPSALRDAKKARRIVEILEEHCWIMRLPPGAVLDEAPRKDAWMLIP